MVYVGNVLINYEQVFKHQIRDSLISSLCPHTYI